MFLRPLGRATATGRYVALAAVSATFALTLSAAGPAASSVNGFAAFCGRLASTNTGPFPVKAIFASSGAQMVCFGRQRAQAAPLSTAASMSSTSATAPSGTFSGGTKNVDAGDPHEDVTASGVQAYGQSETSIAATGQYVVEAWNDATALLTLCGPDQMYKEEATGLGFSADGGQSFTDLGGLPNDCGTGFRYFGDPSVEAYSVGGTAYFYIASLYVDSMGASDLALDACTATGTTLTCPPTPTIIATGIPGCDFLDKDFMTVDPVNQRLYVSYSRFQFCNLFDAGQIELAKCAISAPATPTCDPGTDPTPYFVVSPAGACEQEGAYPAVSSTGDVYVAWEYNWGTSLSRPECATDATHVQEQLAYIPFFCLTHPTASCTGPANQTGVNVTTTEAAFVPGYNRFPMNDFPRIAVSDPYNTVSIVWNDARVHILGDIFMQSFTQGPALTPVQPGPVPLNSLGKGGMHLLPALRNASASGKLTVSWYQRPDANTTLTDVYLNSGIVPTDPNPSQTNSRVTNATSDWGAVSSDIIPNFGDYTDNYVVATPTSPYRDKTLYIAWSDGRLGLPQPFEANVSTP